MKLLQARYIEYVKKEMYKARITQSLEFYVKANTKDHTGFKTSYTEFVESLKPKKKIKTYEEIEQEISSYIRIDRG